MTQRRIKDSDLQQCCDTINRRLGHDLKPYSTNLYGSIIANACVYHLDYAYGGVALDQVSSNGTGSRRVSNGGYGTKRELYTFLLGMIEAVSHNHYRRA